MVAGLNCDPEILERFRRDLDALISRGSRIGVAVSGGPDSVALLLLAAADRPGLVEAATVDHGLRPQSGTEAQQVAQLCAGLGVPHHVLTVTWAKKPDVALQERARVERYKLLALWAKERGLAALLTGHHLDDQAETFLMRLARGAGVRGLSAMRPVGMVPGGDVPLIRPLLEWRRSELEKLCAEAGVDTVEDPSNSDERFERARLRQALAGADWLPAQAIAKSAAHLAEADEALHWAAQRVWEQSVSAGAGAILYTPGDSPREIRRRIVARAIAELASEGPAGDLRGRELDQVLAALGSGQRVTLRGVLCQGGSEWHFSRAPARAT